MYSTYYLNSRDALGVPQILDLVLEPDIVYAKISLNY